MGCVRIFIREKNRLISRKMIGAKITGASALLVMDSLYVAIEAAAKKYTNVKKNNITATLKMLLVI